MSSDELICPSCGSTQSVKNGTIDQKKQKDHCPSCPRQFVPNRPKIYISNETKELIDKF